MSEWGGVSNVGTTCLHEYRVRFRAWRLRSEVVCEHIREGVPWERLPLRSAGSHLVEYSFVW